MISVSRLRLFTPITVGTDRDGAREFVRVTHLDEHLEARGTRFRVERGQHVGRQRPRNEQDGGRAGTRASQICTGWTMKSLRMDGTCTAAATAARSSSDPAEAIGFGEHGNRPAPPAT